MFLVGVDSSDGTGMMMSSIPTSGTTYTPAGN